MASPLASEVPAYEPPPRLQADQRQAEHDRLRVLIFTCAVGFALVVIAALGFGR